MDLAPGTHRHSITLTGSPGSLSQTITIAVIVRAPRVDVQPRTVVANVPRGSNATRVVVISNRGDSSALYQLSVLEIGTRHPLDFVDIVLETAVSRLSF